MSKGTRTKLCLLTISLFIAGCSARNERAEEYGASYLNDSGDLDYRMLVEEGQDIKTVNDLVLIIGREADFKLNDDMGSRFEYYWRGPTEVIRAIADEYGVVNNLDYSIPYEIGG